MPLLFIGGAFYYLISTGDTILDAVCTLLLWTIALFVLMKVQIAFRKKEGSQKKKADEEKRVL